MGLYTGWRLHFIRDTLGTALYFAEYDVMRFYLGRKSGDKRDGQRRGLEEQGELPQWAKGWLPKGLVPFMCGSVAGVTSWALIYPVDVSAVNCTWSARRMEMAGSSDETIPGGNMVCSSGADGGPIGGGPAKGMGRTHRCSEWQPSIVCERTRTDGYGDRKAQF